MSFINRALRPPSYGWADESGELIKPTVGQIFREFFQRLNVFKSKKNWLAFSSWFWALALSPFLILFITKYFEWYLLPIGFVYSMVIMGSHGTVWYHRYATHGAFEFSNAFSRFITQNLVIKVFPEELYVVSHHVHHVQSDLPGDPYNAKAGFLYCFLADVTHQPIALDLTESDYKKATNYLKGAGVKMNTYAQYQKWGSISNPFWSWAHLTLNWAFWYGVFFLIGGHALAFCLFGAAQVWGFGIRTFNYEGHGKGVDKREEGLDFFQEDESINQYWPGYVAGEWHNNHHLFPKSARNGFTKWQLDLPWLYIKFLYLIGGVKSYKNHKDKFMEEYYKPYKEKKQESLS